MERLKRLREEQTRAVELHNSIKTTHSNIEKTRSKRAAVASGATERRIAAVEEELKRAEEEARRLEKEEAQLIERLRKAQELQRSAYDELEKVLTSPRKGPRSDGAGPGQSAGNTGVKPSPRESRAKTRQNDDDLNFDE